MDLWRLAQVAGVLLMGGGIGVAYGLREPIGFTATTIGLLVFAVARIVPWLRRKD